MNTDALKELLKAVQDGAVDIDDAMSRLKHLPYEDLGFAQVDHHRQLRRGFPEVIFCPGKTPEQIAAIFKSMIDHGSNVLASRADDETWDGVRALIPGAVYRKEGRAITYIGRDIPALTHTVAVVCAGTSDIPVAEEAAVTLEMAGSPVKRIFDVGVSGVHRLLDKLDELSDAAVVIVVAGMEGALASVVAGLIDSPVIAVPTSIGYGASFGGLAALLGMLNACSGGISVVNIDNGFGAGYLAALINMRLEKACNGSL